VSLGWATGVRQARRSPVPRMRPSELTPHRDLLFCRIYIVLTRICIAGENLYDGLERRGDRSWWWAGELEPSTYSAQAWAVHTSIGGAPAEGCSRLAVGGCSSVNSERAARTAASVSTPTADPGAAGRPGVGRPEGGAAVPRGGGAAAAVPEVAFAGGVSALRTSLVGPAPRSPRST
jgi:hypothetical protein